MTSFKKLTIIATPSNILVVYRSKRIVFTKEKPEFTEIRELIRAGDEDAIIKRLFENAMIIPEYSHGLFQIDPEREIILDIETKTQVDIFLGRRIVEWAKEGFPFEPLLKFHRKVIKNPSTDSAKELYEFLEKNLIPITNEGNFIAYKKVTSVGEDTDDLVDSHTRTIKNNVGQIVTMPREKVDPDRRNECSYGLHVGAWDYVNSFSGNVVIEVEVEPQDVVAVPKDYNKQKMRVCRYKVMSRSDGDKIESQFVTVDKKKEEVIENVNDESHNGGSVEATINKVDFTTMTAQKIKDYIKEKYGVEITLDNKNKKSIINKAYKIMEGKA